MKELIVEAAIKMWSENSDSENIGKLPWKHIFTEVQFIRLGTITRFLFAGNFPENSESFFCRIFHRFS